MNAHARIAPLNGLRAFEAAARHLSFTAAADELFVTPGAISHQINGLEDFLGVKLFTRGSRSVALTPEAKACLPLLVQGFATIREAVALLESHSIVRPLMVNVAPAFATRWLLPRLASFTNAHPEIELRVSTGLGLIDAVRPEASVSLGETSDRGVSADISIRFGKGLYPGMVSERLFDAEVTPVCGPNLLGGRELESAQELERFTLLHDDTAYFDLGQSDWATWLAAAGAMGIDPSRGPRFSHTGLALDAAEDGVGFALGITALTAADVLAGRLIAPFSLKLPSDYSYHLVYLESLNGHPALKTFRSWLASEAAHDQQLLHEATNPGR